MSQKEDPVEPTKTKKKKKPATKSKPKAKAKAKPKASSNDIGAGPAGGVILSVAATSVAQLWEKLESDKISLEETQSLRDMVVECFPNIDTSEMVEVIDNKLLELSDPSKAQAAEHRSQEWEANYFDPAKDTEEAFAHIPQAEEGAAEADGDEKTPKPPKKKPKTKTKTQEGTAKKKAKPKAKPKKDDNNDAPKGA